jgi:hypothetical protein
MTFSAESSPPLFASDPQSKNKQAPMLDNSRATFLYWFLGFCPLVGRSCSPIVIFMMNRAMKKPSDTPVKLYNKLVAEASRQFAKGALGVISYFGLAELVQGIINYRNKAKGNEADPNAAANANFWKTITGQVATTLISLTAGGLFVPMEKLLERDDNTPHKPIINPKFRELILSALKNPDGSVSSSFSKIEALLKRDAAPKPLQPILKSHTKQKIHNFLDKHLTKEGVPQIGRAATASTLALIVSLSSLALLVYALTKTFGSQADDAEGEVVKKPAQPTPMPTSPALPFVNSAISNLNNSAPLNPSFIPEAAYGQMQMQNFHMQQKRQTTSFGAMKVF